MTQNDLLRFSFTSKLRFLVEKRYNYQTNVAFEFVLVFEVADICIRLHYYFKFSFKSEQIKMTFHTPAASFSLCYAMMRKKERKKNTPGSKWNQVV